MRWLIGSTLFAWATGIFIGLYVGISILVFDVDFGGRGRVGSKHKHRIVRGNK